MRGTGGEPPAVVGEPTMQRSQRATQVERLTVEGDDEGLHATMIVVWSN
jgi:hypothetical protein